MTAGQPDHSTKMYCGMSSKANAFQVDVQNSWDALTEIAIASYSEPTPQLDHLALLLESHGIVVHRIPAPHIPSHSYTSTGIRPSYVADPFASPIRLHGAANGGTSRQKPGVNARPLSLFPQSVALVYGTRVIEVPSVLSRTSADDASQSGGSQQDQGATEHTHVLFSLLESAGVDVVRWPTTPSGRKSTTSERTLVEIEETTGTTDIEDEGPRFSPSDILILSPTLLITRLSSCTNNKGLEYLWSVLSQPTKPIDPTRKDADQDGRTPISEQAPSKPPRPTTTLLVRITEHEASTTNSPAISACATYSPRASIHSINQITSKHSLAPYTPLCRALVPMDGRVMLYDPALVADGEARRLKSVLDRLQEGSRGSGGSGDMTEIFAAKASKRDSAISYGTFGSVEHSDDDGWQFISVEGLHLTSILLVSSRLALLSLAPPSTPAASPTLVPSNQDALTKVSQVLTSLGMRAVTLPFSEVNEKGGAVRDAVMVLRRETYVDTSDDGDAEREQQNAWDQSSEEPTVDCFEAMAALLSSFFCGLFASMATSSSESDISQ